MYESLRDFINALEHAGELRRISASVSSNLEITHIADLVSKSNAPSLPSKSAQRTDPLFHTKGGHALLFENVQGSDFPLLINAWGSYKRVEMALGCTDTTPARTRNPPNPNTTASPSPPPAPP